ncbi:MAG TPA: hypothetical protein O0X39_00725 [Methanocorpusculum sp.]|nr:hypothetical protein [Methanocorpusculum sp.]
MESAFLCLKKHDITKAYDILELVLEHNPQCAKAYVGKVLALRNLSKEKDLNRVNPEFAYSPEYIKAMDYASGEYKEQLVAYKNESEYQYALLCVNANDSSMSVRKDELKTALEIFERLGDYKDSQKFLKAYSNVLSLLEKTETVCGKVPQNLQKGAKKVMTLKSVILSTVILIILICFAGRFLLDIVPECIGSPDPMVIVFILVFLLGLVFFVVIIIRNLISLVRRGKN